jgi:hypothetical protein
VVPRLARFRTIPPGRRVEARARLVEEEQLGVANDPELKPALLSTRQALHVGSGFHLQANRTDKPQRRRHFFVSRRMRLDGHFW